MFSYLRPRSRHGATNSSETPDISKGSQPVSEIHSRTSPLQHPHVLEPSPQIFRAGESYIPPVSSRAPTLPPIPRVASIYGAPTQASSPEQPQNGASHSRVQSIEEATSPQQFESSPKSATSTGGSRLRGNFSRPFHIRDGSGTPSEEHRNLQDIWRTAAQTAQHSGLDGQSRGQTFQPSKTSPSAPQTIITDTTRVNAVRPLRMPFQDSEPLTLITDQTRPTLGLSTAGSHLRQVSEGSIAQNSREADLYSRTTKTRPSDSQLSLPISHTKESILSPVKQNPAGSSMASNPNQSRPSRFTRLNPISLLTRRRSSQPSAQPENDTYRRNLMFGNTLPQDYVGIRGNRVHDFSAPRPRQVASHQTVASNNYERSSDGASELSYAGRTSRDDPSPIGGLSASLKPKPEPSRAYTPGLRESFEDDDQESRKYGQDNAQNKDAISYSDHSSEEYYDSDSDSSSDTYEAPRDPLLLGDPTFGLFSAPDSSLMPQEFSFIVPEHLAGPPLPNKPRSRSQTPHQDRSSKNRSFLPPPAARSSRSRSQTPPSRDLSPKDQRAPRSASTPPLRESRTPSPQLTHLPRHSKSNASRFSFDMAGFGSSVQEKLLEDKHRQKISKDLRASKISQMSVPETDDGFDSDDPGFDDDIEEEIPGMHIDEDDFPEANLIANSTLDSRARNVNPESQPVNQLYTHKNVNMDLNQQAIEEPIPKELPKPSKSFILRSSMFDENEAQLNVNDDFYFDDGAIEDADLATSDHFDESLFDDPSYRIGQHLQTSLAVVPEQASQESSLPSTRPMSQESKDIVAGHGPQASTDSSIISLSSAQPWEKTAAVKRSSLLRNDLTTSHENQADLTHGNLAAYHDALALAAQQAANQGRFNRDVNDEEDDSSDANLNLRPTPGRTTAGKQHVDADASYDDIQEKVAFDDYEQEDDDVIAAANADALRYDEDFYGEEFHFYSTGDGAGESQYGGYFVGDIKRSHSGRANGQEPSLTPITEISEWSTRDSMVLPGIDKGHITSSIGIQQPGLAQIADSIRGEEDDLSLSSLKRLRQNAFASSASSLGNGSSGKNATPPASSSVLPPRSSVGHSRSQSERSHPLRIQSSEQDDSIVDLPQTGPDHPSSVSSHFKKGHSRNNSGAESVAYVQQNDADGSHWVLERRRRTDDGATEILGRQVVEGGRI